MTRLSRENLERLLVPREQDGIPGKITLWEQIVLAIKGVGTQGSESYIYHPLTGNPIVYCPERAKRPVPKEEKKEKKTEVNKCTICDGETTPILSYLPLREDHYAFVNLNLFPAMDPISGARSSEKTARQAFGAHLLVWPTTDHKDIHELTPEDHAKSFSLMQDLERRLSCLSKGEYLQIIKNTGRIAGSSIDHGHYQVIATNVIPGVIKLAREFRVAHGKSFVTYLQEKAGSGLVIKEYRTIRVITPPWLRRHLEAVIIPKNMHRERISDLTEEECLDLARATTDIARACHRIMPRIGKEFAYNMIFNAGEGIGTLWVDMLPATQISGGFELGVFYLCQSSSELSTATYQEALQS